MFKPAKAVDLEALIDGVRDRPALWNTRCSEYTDKLKKMQCWREIILKLEKGYDELDKGQQKEIAKEVQKKWKHIRQNYKREVDARRQMSGSQRKKRSSYVYFETLSFLAPVFERNETNTNVTSDRAMARDVSLPEPSQDNSDESFGTKPKKPKRESDDSPIPINVCSAILKESLGGMKGIEGKRNTVVEEEDDMLFLLSLLKYTKKVPEEEKLEMRVEIIQVITKYIKKNQQNSQPQLQSAPLLES